MNKNLIIVILIVILMAVFIIGYASIISINNSNQYQRVNLSSTCSLEIPNVHFDVQNSSFGGSYGDLSSHTDGKVMYSNKVNIIYAKTTYNQDLSLNGYYGDDSMQSSFGNKNMYSRSVYNTDTGESLLISGEDKEVVDHVADSVQFSSGKKMDGNNTSTSGNGTANSNNQNNDHKIVGYDQDGNPVYEGSEPWVWVDSNGMKHWSPEHQAAANQPYSYESNPTPTPQTTGDYSSGGGSSSGGSSSGGSSSGGISSEGGGSAPT